MDERIQGREGIEVRESLMAAGYRSSDLLERSIRLDIRHFVHD
jgi:hypothetical protein